MDADRLCFLTTQFGIDQLSTGELRELIAEIVEDLYVDERADGDGYTINLDKEWDGADTLQHIAVSLRYFLSVPEHSVTLPDSCN